MVSIPFIAGQWSLHEPDRRIHHADALVSIPFIAGQWSLLKKDGSPSKPRMSFNPLHCGAVVASPGNGSIYCWIGFCFNPLHCGAVVASRGVLLNT